MTNDKSWTEREGKGNTPTVIYDNGHGTRLKLWTNEGKNGEFETASLETGYYKGEQWVETKVSLNRDTFLSLAKAFGKADDVALERELARNEQNRGQSRAA